jgi:lipid-binding SYLF domain-containing protein
MHTLLTAVLIAIALPAVPGARRADDARLKAAELVLTEMAGSSDKGIPKSLLTKAICVVIIPGVKKAALGVGGQYGRGYISCRLDKPSQWSAPGGIRIEGGSVGLQIGGAETDIILLVMNKSGVDRLLTNNFKVGADAAVAAGPVGREATAQTDVTLRAEMLSWSRARGVFAGISLAGCY